MTHKQIDFIADLYIPLLGLVTFLYAGYLCFLAGKKKRRGAMLYLFLAIACAYTVMFIDHYLQIWLLFGLDYSTHTAVAFMLVSVWYFYNKRVYFVFAATLIIYFCVMLYQKYHTLGDILSTLGALSFIAYVMNILSEYITKKLFDNKYWS